MYSCCIVQIVIASQCPGNITCDINNLYVRVLEMSIKNMKLVKRIVSLVLLLVLTVGILPTMERHADAATYYSVKFFANGGQNCKNGTKDFSQAYQSGKTVTMPNYYTRSGYIFTGWLLNNGSGKVYKANDKVTVTGNIQFIAQWKKATVGKCAHNSPSSTVTTIRNATCLNDGTKKLKCSVCSTTWEESITATGHKYAVYDDGGRAVIKCSKCSAKYSSTISLELFAYFWGGANKGLQNYSADEKKKMKVAWMSYTFDITLDEAVHTFAYYDNGGSDLGLICEDADDFLMFTSGLIAISKFAGFEYLWDCSSILKRARLVVALVNPDKSPSSKFLTVIRTINPVAAEILNYYEKIYKSMETLALAGQRGASITDLAESINKVCSRGYQYITLQDFANNLDAICKAFCGKDYATVCEYNGEGLKPTNYQYAYDAIRVAAMWYAERDFKRITSGTEIGKMTFEEYMKETKRIDREIKDNWKKIKNFYKAIIPKVN